MEVPLVHDRGFEFVNPRLVMSNSGKSITLSESGDYMRMPCLGFMNVLARPHIVGPGQNVHENPNKAYTCNHLSQIGLYFCRNLTLRTGD